MPLAKGKKGLLKQIAYQPSFKMARELLIFTVISALDELGITALEKY